MKQEYAAIVHGALKEAGINFVAYLPDDQIHDAQKVITEDPSFTTVGATNEGEAVAACAGAWLGGAKAALLIADAHRRTAIGNRWRDRLGQHGPRSGHRALLFVQLTWRI